MPNEHPRCAPHTTPETTAATVECRLVTSSHPPHPHRQFRPKLKALQDEGLVEVDGDSYIDSGVGFIRG